MLTRREFSQLVLTLASGAGVSVALGEAVPLGGPLPASVGARQGMKTRGLELSVGNVQINVPHTAIAPVGYVDLHVRSEEHTSELQSRQYLVCRLLLEKKKKK